MGSRVERSEKVQLRYLERIVLGPWACKHHCRSAALQTTRCEGEMFQSKTLSGGVTGRHGTFSKPNAAIDPGPLSASLYSGVCCPPMHLQAGTADGIALPP